MKKILLNRYFLSLLAFSIWLGFFDKNNLVFRHNLNKELNTHREQKKWFEQQIENTRRESSELETNLETLEKFAREKYFMKRADEDIYIMIREE